MLKFQKSGQAKTIDGKPFTNPKLGEAFGQAATKTWQKIMSGTPDQSTGQDGGVIEPRPEAK